MDNGCTFRERNLKYILNTVVQLSLPVILAEQCVDSTNNKRYTTSNARHCKYNHSITMFHKTWLLNSALEEVKTPYVWILDGDCYFNYQQSYDAWVPDTYYQPYGVCKDLNEVQTRDIIKNKDIPSRSMDSNGTDDREVKMYGAMSFIAPVDKIYQLDMFNEKYVGYGYEDYDIYIKARNNGKIIIASHVNAVHLWHPPTHKGLLYNKEIFHQTGNTKQSVKNQIESDYSTMNET
jgi:hypothetical protein